MSKYAQIICINYATDNYLKLNPFQQFIFWVENNSYFTWVEIIKLKEVGIRSAVQEWTRQQVYLVGNVRGSYMYSTKVVVEGGGQVRYSQPSSKDKKRKEKKNLVISLQIPKIVLKHFKNSQIRVRL